MIAYVALCENNVQGSPPSSPSTGVRKVCVVYVGMLHGWHGWPGPVPSDGSRLVGWLAVAVTGYDTT